MRLSSPNALSHRDMDVLHILWENSEPMTALQITNANIELTTNTVQAVLRKLLKKNLIEVADIVYSGTVLCRSYRPAVSEKDFALRQFNQEYRTVQDKISKSLLIASLLGNETNPDILRKDIDELQSMLDEYRKKIPPAGGENE